MARVDVGCGILLGIGIIIGIVVIWLVGIAIYQGE